jgi:predicted MFS family arabinose efflux permease
MTGGQARGRRRVTRGARPRAAATMIFFSHGFLFASWTAHIPHVKQALGLSNSDLGLVLLATPVGSVCLMLVTGRLLPVLGSRRLTGICLLGYCATGPFVGLAATPVLLFAALFVWGAFQGSLDVAMNTQAVAVQRRLGGHLMPGFHGAWSLGSFAGAGAGALAVGLRVALTPQLLLLTIPVLGAAGVGIAAVSALGWAGFVCGPPLIGTLAGLAGLDLALAVIPVLSLVITIATARSGAIGAPHRQVSV